jgi:hypothetical protein
MSFRNNLSIFWENVHSTLFPMLETTCGELSPNHKKLAAILELIRIEEKIPSTRWNFGRPCKDRHFIARAFIAKIVFKLPYTKQLVELLKTDKQLRMLCGWSAWSKIPSESKFSRVFKEFSETSLPEKVHQALIKEIYKDQISIHVTKDSTPLKAREKTLKKPSQEVRKKLKNERQKRERNGELNRRQKQLKENSLDAMIVELPKPCDNGMKRNNQGYTMTWKGYKLHAAIDDNCIPLAAIVTSASLQDCEAAIPLAAKSHQVALNFYDLMDAAYDLPEIKEHSISLGHVPIVDFKPWSIATKKEKIEEQDRKKLLNFKTAEDIRYRQRMPKERFNALYKDYFGGNAIFYRGNSKVTCHVMFGILTLTATTLIRLIS